MPARPSGELARMTKWSEARFQRLEDELTPEGIAAALQAQELFPEIDQGGNDLKRQTMVRKIGFC